LQQQASIISYCSISNNSVYKNGEELFTGNAENMQQFFIQIYHNLAIDYPRFYKMDNLSKLGFLAAEYVLKDSPADLQARNNEAALVLSNSNASLDTDVKYFHTIEEGASPALFVYTLANIVIGEICIRNKFKGNGAFLVFEKFNAAFTVQYVNDLFNNSNTKLCICGWVDVLDEQYKAVLFLVSANKVTGKLLFNAATMDRIFKSV
jgi:hypothetical protein